MSKKILTDNSVPAASASFASVIQPSYRWDERQPSTATFGGSVAFPSKKGETAVLLTPTVDTPECRAVRQRELLHARFTPDIQAAAKRAVNHGLSRSALRLAEGVRLKRKGDKLDAFGIVDGYLDQQKAAQFVYAIAATKPDDAPYYKPYVPTLNTLKTVQAAISLLAYPVRGLDPLKVRDLLPAAQAYALTVGKHVIEDLDDVTTTEILTDLAARIDEAFATKRKGKQAEAALYIDIANAVEDALARAYEADIKPPAPSGAGENGDGDDTEQGDNESEGSGDGSKSDEGEQNKPQDDESDDQGKDDDTDASGDEEAEAQPKKSATAAAKPDFRPKGKSTLDDKLTARSQSLKKSRAKASGSASAASADDLTAFLSAQAKAHADQAVRVARDEAKDAEAIQKLPLLAEYNLDANDTKWAPMKIQRANFVRSKRALVPQRGKAGFDGTFPRHYTRWFTDRAILDCRGRRPGGTLLIDVSGSMSWATAQTQLLLELCPALTVAFYSSSWGSRDNAGVLTIVAQHGRTIDPKEDWRDKYNHATGNVCDGPALSWLARQPGPRIWFCDLYVTGRGDRISARLLREAVRIAALSQVTATTSVDEVIGILGGRLPPRPLSLKALQAVEDKTTDKTALEDDSYGGHFATSALRAHNDRDFAVIAKEAQAVAAELKEKAGMVRSDLAGSTAKKTDDLVW